MAKLLTAANIANEIGASETTVRRHLGTFEDFFLCRKIGRATKYDAASVPLVKKISGLYNEGYSTDEIKQQLSQEETFIPSVVTDDGNGAVGLVANMPQALLTQVRAVVELLVEQKTYEIQTRIDELEQSQEQSNTEQKMALAKLSQSINKRDTQLLETIRKMMERQKEESKSWWQKLFKYI